MKDFQGFQGKLLATKKSVFFKVLKPRETDIFSPDTLWDECKHNEIRNWPEPSGGACSFPDSI